MQSSQACSHCRQSPRQELTGLGVQRAQGSRRAGQLGAHLGEAEPEGLRRRRRGAMQLHQADDQQRENGHPDGGDRHTRRRHRR